jgi:hypothetical protein
MGKIKKAFRAALFKLKPVHIVATLIVFLIFVIFLFSAGLSYLFKTQSTFGVLLLLTILLLLTRITVLTKVGIGFLTFILFPVQMIFGFWIAFIMVWVSTAAYCYIASKQTPIDFAINKSAGSAFVQGVYTSFWVVSLAILFKIVSISTIVSNLTLTYMIGVFLYVVFMVIALPTFAKEPVPMVLINGMIMFPIQFLLITVLGPRFIQFLLSIT